MVFQKKKDYELIMNEIVLQTELPDITLIKRGKVRDIYDIDQHLLIIATDRVSAFDVVLPDGIPGKGRVLTQISLYWFQQMEDIIQNHIVASHVEGFPERLKKYADVLKDRSMLVKKAKPLPIECVVRGYLSGSGWKAYKEGGSVCGIHLPKELVNSSKLHEPIFTPSTKADEGHDINITLKQAEDIVGKELANKLKDVSLRIYSNARDKAEKKGIIIADTKFEFGLSNDTVIIIDEILTPDSSRFWSLKDYAPGKSQDSYDKQIIRDYLLTLDWDQTYPGPSLPEEIIKKAAQRYDEILKILTA
jgi:phosphoribosylaminoimidazole-succinocarboxamide synthase